MTLFIALFLWSCIVGVKASGDFKFDESLSFNNNNFYVKDASFIYGDSGCGAANDKCSCKIDGSVLKMHGVGTDSSMTGLTFSCSYGVYEPKQNQKLCDCVRFVDIPYFKSNRDSFKCPCLKMHNYKPLSPSGHVFDIERSLSLEPVNMVIDYCEKGLKVFNSTGCYKETDLIKNNNHQNGTCPDDGFKYVREGDRCRCWKNSYKRREFDQACPAGYDKCLVCQDHLSCVENGGNLNKKAQGWCPDDGYYVPTFNDRANSGKCITNCEHNKPYHTSGDDCIVCDEEYRDNVCMNASYPFYYKERCYATCPNGQINFEDTCISEDKVTPKTRAHNACLIDTYEHNENWESTCDNDCDCNGKRMCKSGKCDV